MNITIEEAHALACQIIGEGVVRERLLSAEIQRLSTPPDDA